MNPTLDSRLSNRVQGIKPSAIRRFFDLANGMKGDIISLSIGEPDFITPWQVRLAGIQSLEQGKTHYSPNQGYPEFREGISTYIKDRFSLNYSYKNEILVTVGGSEAIDLALRSVLNPGDEVLIPEPSYVAYRSCVSLSDGICVGLPLSASTGFKLTREDLERAYTSKTKVLLVAYPNNPTGGIMTREDWIPVIEFLKEHPEILLISDELYAELTYNDAGHCSPCEFEEIKERSLLIGGFSKSFAMTGFRVGYAAGPSYLIAAMNKIHQYMIMSAPSTAQYAALEALRGEKNDQGDLVEVARMREAYDQRRHLILKRFKDIGLPCFEPEGAFYVFPDISARGLDSVTFAERFLRKYKVAIVPGSAFSDNGEGYVRISYAASIDQIELALDRLECFMNEKD